MIRKIIFSSLKLAGIDHAFTRKRDFGVTVVCFHQVSNIVDDAYPPMPVEVFTRLIKYFAENFSVILPEQISQATDKPKLIITFDDGYKNFSSNVLPILLKYNVPCVMNVVVNSVITGQPFWTQKLSLIINRKLAKKASSITFEHIDKTFAISPSNAEWVALNIFHELKNLSPEFRDNIIDSKILQEDKDHFPLMMNVDDVKKCIENNVVIGSHSYTHEILGDNTSEEILQKEIATSKSKLESLIQRPVEIFASPNGIFSEKILNKAAEAGYKYLFTTQNKIYTPATASKIEIVPRIILFDKSVSENIFRTSLFHKKLAEILLKK